MVLKIPKKSEFKKKYFVKERNGDKHAWSITLYIIGEYPKCKFHTDQYSL